MYKIKIVCVGKINEVGLKHLETQYLKRMSQFAKVTLQELKEIPYSEKHDLDRVKLKEAELISNHISKDSVVILLDVLGVERNSNDFANFINRLAGLGDELIFVLGGSLGVHESLKHRTNHIISLSKLTFSHKLARILLLEQLFRTGSIINDTPYHK